MDSVTDVESTLFDTQSLKDSVDILDDYDAIILVHQHIWVLLLRD